MTRRNAGCACQLPNVNAFRPGGLRRILIFQLNALLASRLGIPVAEQRVRLPHWPGLCVSRRRCFDEARRHVRSSESPRRHPVRTSMAERKNTHGLQLARRRDVVIVDIGEMEIWDGADLSLIRDTLNRLILKQRRRAVGIQMRSVKYVPSGFFGMLYDWHDQGITVRLYAPQPRVTGMLWFQRFFEPDGRDCYVLRDNPECYDDFLERDEVEELATWEDSEDARTLSALRA